MFIYRSWAINSPKGRMRERIWFYRPLFVRPQNCDHGRSREHLLSSFRYKYLWGPFWEIHHLEIFKRADLNFIILLLLQSTARRVGTVHWKLQNVYIHRFIWQQIVYDNQHWPYTKHQHQWYCSSKPHKCVKIIEQSPRTKAWSEWWTVHTNWSVPKKRNY